MKSRKKKLLFRTGLILVLYLALSWSAFLLPPRFEIGPGVPPEAEEAVREFCRESDYLYGYQWGPPNARFFPEPITHQELRERKIIITLLPSGEVMAKSASTGMDATFRHEKGEWEIRSKLCIF